MKLLAHRGFWNETTKKNSEESFIRAFSRGYGIETDLRDFSGEVVISHDVPSGGEMTLRELISVAQSYKSTVLALNIKSDGLQELMLKCLPDDLDYFVFDMSVPDALQYRRHEFKFFTRYSDIETQPSLLDSCSGIWLDNFSTNILDVNALSNFLERGLHVAVVSPELHGLDYQQHWKQLLGFMKANPETNDLIMLCTDFPDKAEEYFK